jgi:hypothetical protein
MGRTPCPLRRWSRAAAYLRARLQHRLPETSIRRLLGLIAVLIAARYIQVGAQDDPPAHPAHAVAT